MMGVDLQAFASTVAVWALPVLLAITLHEAAHGWVAWRLGDDTAYQQGRVTFNPLRHIDPFGTILLPALLLLMGAPFLFGWAKPVPVRFSRLRHPRRDMVLVAAAGPGINLALAVISALLVHVAVQLPEYAAEWAFRVLGASLFLNVILAVFNMIPLPPLDGGRVAVGLLPAVLARPLARLERYGMLIILALVFLLPLLGRELGVPLNIFAWVVAPIVQFVQELIAGLTGLR
jgi:Zn-dependent protease